MVSSLDKKKRFFNTEKAPTLYMYQHTNFQVFITIGHKKKITFNIIMIISMHVINVIVIIYILITLIIMIF